MTWSLPKKKQDNFCTVYFVRMKFIGELCLILYLIDFQNIHAFTYSKKFTSFNFFLFSKIVESLQCVLKKRRYRANLESI